MTELRTKARVRKRTREDYTFEAGTLAEIGEDVEELVRGLDYGDSIVNEQYRLHLRKPHRDASISEAAISHELGLTVVRG